jgi:hypothetical protein
VPIPKVPAATFRTLAVVFAPKVNVPPLPLIFKVAFVYVQFLMARLPLVAAYSTVEPLFNVGVETVSSPVNFKVPVTENVPETLSALPARLNVPDPSVRAPFTVRLLARTI